MSKSRFHFTLNSESSRILKNQPNKSAYIDKVLKESEKKDIEDFTIKEKPPVPKPQVRLIA